ncbi:Outer membrane stress sensor protease DegS [hydrothermal vent metagenome]|uniref:Outer membrane stress sensor protease DegS n=1 Tax=hydrothermal vent metagenome TaxID=652676 RepID=A0A3B0XXX5_9ZZZZ
MGGVLIVLSSVNFSSLFNRQSIVNTNRDSYADAVNKAAPSVVSIKAFYRAQKDNSLLPFTPPLKPLTKNNSSLYKIRPNKGSGVIISTAGYIVTNHHVVSGADRIEVTLHNGRRLEAKILGLDADSDLAVITTELDHLPALTIADSSQIRIGDIVLAIGNPFGIGQTVTQGIISATGRDRIGLNTYENFIQTDAAINPGNSGGALINTRGEMLGINSAVFSKSGAYFGISFAIPIDLVLDVVKQIIEHGEVIRGWLGVEGVDLNDQVLERIGLPNIQGVLITDVFDHGPAEMAGIRVGDIITHINKKAIRDTRDVLNAIADGHPGDKIDILGIRERQSFISQAILEKRPSQ